MKNERIFIPGSEWVYIKLYTGIISADKMLIENIFPFVKSLKKRKLVNEFFFIRYRDPEFHLRLRLKLTSLEFYGKVYELFLNRFSKVVDNNLIWKVQCDTYKREMERYGSNTIEIAESIFSIDSEAVMEFIQILQDENLPQNMRWLISLKFVDQYLRLFFPEVLIRSRMIMAFGDNFKREFGFYGQSQKPLNEKYRVYRKEIESTMEVKLHAAIEVLLFEKEKKLLPFIQMLLEYDQAKKLQVHLPDLVGSLIHMMMNRIFRTDNRQYELLVYHFLAKYYQSVIALSNKSNPELILQSQASM